MITDKAVCPFCGKKLSIEESVEKKLDFSKKELTCEGCGKSLSVQPMMSISYEIEDITIP